MSILLFLVSRHLTGFRFNEWYMSEEQRKTSQEGFILPGRAGLAIAFRSAVVATRTLVELAKKLDKLSRRREITKRSQSLPLRD